MEKGFFKRDGCNGVTRVTRAMNENESDGGKNYSFTNSFRLILNKIYYYYKYILFFILVGIFLYYSANSDSGFCDDTFIFYKNNINREIIKIDTFDYKAKGFTIILKG
jgi:hypothetical protein